MDLAQLVSRFNREQPLKIRVIKCIVGSITLLIGGMIYLVYRSKELLMFDWVEKIGLTPIIDNVRNSVETGGVYDWVKYNLPDGLWIFAYMFIMDSIWNGKNIKIANMFIYVLPIIAIISELLQAVNLIGGVFDVMDLLSYCFAIVLFWALKLI